MMWPKEEIPYIPVQPRCWDNTWQLAISQLCPTRMSGYFSQICAISRQIWLKFHYNSWHLHCIMTAGVLWTLNPVMSSSYTQRDCTCTHHRKDCGYSWASVIFCWCGDREIAQCSVWLLFLWVHVLLMFDLKHWVSKNLCPSLPFRARTLNICSPLP